MARPPLRRFVRWALVALAGAAAVYLVGINLLLNVGLGRALVNLRPRSVKLSWRAAWTLWPGHLAVRGFEIQGQMRSRAWSVGIDRAAARWGVLPLLRRELRFSGLRAEGVRTRVRRVSYTPPPGMAPTGSPISPAPPRPLRTWRFTFDGVAARRVGEVDLFGLITDCAGGDASGSFGYQIAGQFHIDDAHAVCRAARLRAGEYTLVRDASVEVRADLAGYSPREHPGLAGFDFLSGRLSASGAADTRALLARIGPAAAAAEVPPAGTLALELRLAEGVLAEGSFVRLASGADAPSLTLEVSGSPAATAVRFAAPSLEISGGEAAGGAATKPLFASGPIRFTGSTVERRLSRLFAATRALRATGEPAEIGLRGALELDSPRLAFDGTRGALELEATRVTGTADLAALFARQIRVDGLAIESAAVRFLPRPSAEAPSEAAAAWTVAVADAQMHAVRELTVGENRFVGPFDVAFTGGLSPAKGFELEHLTVDAPRLDVFAGGDAASRGASLEVDLRMAPIVFDVTTARQSLRGISGRLRFAGRVSSLGILERFLRRMPGLEVDGGGDLTADVLLRDGRLDQGSEIRLRHGALRATILDSVATGEASLSASVRPAAGKPRAAIDVVFHRYGLASSDGERAYVRGSNLRLGLASGDLDLADLVEDLTAHVEAHGADIPDLRAYNAYLPAGAGLTIESGAGRLDLTLDYDYAKRTALGTLGVKSPEVAVQFADVLLRGRLEVDTRLAATGLERRRFDLKGTRLNLEEVSFHETGEEASAENSGWWARLEIPRGHVELQRPLTLDASADLRMKDSGFLLSVASRRKRFLSWFAGILDQEDVVARSLVSIGGGAIRIDPLRAEGGKLDLRARMHLAKGSRRIDVFLRHGHLAAGLELRDGKRDIKLLRPEAWYDSREGFD